MILKIVQQNPILAIIKGISVDSIIDADQKSICDPFILNNQDHQALYVLCKPDFEWVFDPLREDPKKRDQIFNYYKKELKENGMDFIIVEGSNNKRFDY